MIRTSLLTVLAIVAFVVLVVFAVGGFSSAQHTAHMETTVGAQRSVVWSVVNNFDALSERQPHILFMQILGQNADGYTAWYARTSGNVDAVFLIEDYVYEESFILRLDESVVGMTGTWTYSLECLDEHTTVVRITEESNMSSWFLRGLLVLMGRMQFIEQEIDGIQHQAEAL